MPTIIDIDSAVLKWQAKHNRRLTYDELAELAGISIAALYRMKSGEMITPDLRKINNLCKVLECEPGDLIKREDTTRSNPIVEFEIDTLEVKKHITEKTKQRLKRLNGKDTGKDESV
jgi:putative transcriptional regulator